jgi:hypothetical protein
MKYFLYTFLTVLVSITTGFAQLPSTDIYLFTYKIEGDSLQLSKAKFLTDFNSGSYNNQPFFFSYSDLYITSYNQEEKQTDILRLDLTTEELYEVTNTLESEYSPTIMPGKRFFSCIKAFPDEENTQLLWKYPVNQSNRGSVIFKDIKNVGYHYWLSRQKVALFLVGPPHKLTIADVETQENRLVLENIGRTFKVSKRGNLLFIHKATENVFYIKEYDPVLNRASIITPTLEGVEDFDVLEDGSLIMGKGSDLYRFVPGKSTNWVKAASLERFKITDIGRLGSYFDRIALVSRN